MNPSALSVVLRVFLLLGVFASSAAAEPEDPRRAYKMLRDSESWAFLREQKSTDFWDPLKYLRLSHKRTDLYLTVGGEARLWGELFHDEQWGGTGTEHNGSFLQRYMLHADLHLTRYVRMFVQLKSGISAFRVGGPRPVDQDLLDFNQFYLDVAIIPGATLDDEPRLVVRGGRQELSYGSGRLVDVREGPNVRVGFDGLRIIARPGPLRLDAFVVRPALTAAGVFDDAWDSSQWFWGMYATVNLPFLTADAYYLGRDRDSARYERATGHEIRHTTGARARAKLRFLELEVEAAYQFGALGGLPISAWTVAGELVLHNESLLLKPRLVLGGGATSGDQGTSSATLGTFSALFPKGAYFGMFAANGPMNNIAPHAALQLALPAAVTLLGELWAFFRQSPTDGVYNVPGILLRPSSGNPARYLGSQVEVWLTWQASHHFSLNGTFGYFSAGDFFRASLPGEDVTYLAVWMTYKF